MRSYPGRAYHRDQFMTPLEYDYSRNRSVDYAINSRYQQEPRAMPRRGNSNWCVVVLTVIIVLLLIGLAVAIPLVLRASSGGRKDVDVVGSMRITSLEYRSELRDTQSATFNEYEEIICGQVLAQITSWQEQTLACRVSQFRPGSVIVMYTVTVQRVSGEVEDETVIRVVADEIYNKITNNQTSLVVDSSQNSVVFEGDADYCDPNPCAANTRCIREPYRYKCECLEGFQKSGDGACLPIVEGGKHCEGSPCENGGVCIGLTQSYKCVCPHGLNGDNCEINSDNCAVDSCNMKGDCIDLVNDFACDCDNGYAGDFCEQNIDDCLGEPCSEHGTCIDGVASFNCTCGLGFDGPLCQNNINDCASNPCKHGDCIDQVNMYSCECYPGYTGTNCQTNSDNCAVDSCNMKGDCIDLVNDFACDCDNGYAGDFCEQNIDDCSGEPCSEHGTCIDGVASFNCTCGLGFDGPLCQNNINDCASNPCKHGDCIDQVNMYSCECYPGYTGTNCQINSVECAVDSCNSKGRCIDLVNGFECDCEDGYAGNFCEESQPLGYCLPNPCKNSGECSVEEDGSGFKCTCPPPFAGTFCTAVEMDVATNEAVWMFDGNIYGGFLGVRDFLPGMSSFNSAQFVVNNYLAFHAGGSGFSIRVNGTFLGGDEMLCRPSTDEEFDDLAFLNVGEWKEPGFVVPETDTWVNPEEHPPYAPYDFYFPGDVEGSTITAPDDKKLWLVNGGFIICRLELDDLNLNLLE